MKNKKLIGGVVVIVLVILGVFVFNSRKIIYTKEFTYLPQYKSMSIEKSKPSQKGQFGNAVYKVKGADYKKYLTNYVKVLKRDGWKIVEDKKPENIEAKKEGHIARINAVHSDDYITVLIWTK